MRHIGLSIITRCGYNAADLPTWMKYPADNAGNLGETVNFTYNTQMLVDRVYGTTTYVDDTWYDAAGRITLRELGASYTLGQSYAYFPWTQQGGRLQSLQSGIAADTDSLQSLSYSYDAGGNVLSITDYKAGGTQTQTFTYDALDRLVSAVASGGTGGTYGLQNYTYHPDTGNLASNAGITYTYGDSAHKHAVTGTSNGNSYSYDANGNQTSRRVGGITYTLIYDAENRLVQIKRGSNIQATYTYDGDGNRVKTVVGSTTTAYVGNFLEWTGSTATMKRYYYSGGQRVAMRQGSSTLYYLLTDHLGSTSITATSAGGFYTELRYYPWGGTRYASGTTPTSYRYTGQREAEVGLYHYGARFYDPSLGRFIQADTIIPNPGIPVSYDRFAYVRNSPLNYIDPSGHLSCSNSNVAEGDCSELDDEEILKIFYNVVFLGDWSPENIHIVLLAVRLVGEAFLKANIGLRTAGDAFKAAYGLNDGDTFLFEWDENCWGCREDPTGCDAGTTTGAACVSAYGYTNGENWIEFASMSEIDTPLRQINNVIHELGHAFNIRLGRAPENALNLKEDLLVRDEGFYGPDGNITWQQSRGTGASEIFADQFLGWVYGLWGPDDLGPLRAEFMEQMNGPNGWVATASGLP
jgi:RHS repeat-associated protein